MVVCDAWPADVQLWLQEDAQQQDGTPGHDERGAGGGE